MSAIVVDEAHRRLYEDQAEPVLLQDATGHTFGMFVPLILPRPSDPGWEAAEAACPYTPAELERMHEETEGRTLTEILKSLGHY